MDALTRRRFLQYSAGVGAALALPGAARTPAANAAPGLKLTKYLEPVPLPGNGIVVAKPSGTNEYSFVQREISRHLHPELPPTPLWAYDDGSGLGGQAGSFGMAVVGHSGTPLDVSFENNLPRTYPDWIPVDTRLTPTHDNVVRLMTHLHGGFVAAASDGNPAVTPDGFVNGETQHVHYTNQQPQMPAEMLWFHDHGFGATRLNVFAGLATEYIPYDNFDTGAPTTRTVCPPGRSRYRWSSRTGSSTRMERFSIRPATSRVRPGPVSTSATSCSSTARSGRSWRSSRACTASGS